MTMRIRVINDDQTRIAEIESYDRNSEDDEFTLGSKYQLEPKEEKDFYIYKERYISIKEI